MAVYACKGAQDGKLPPLPIIAEFPNLDAAWDYLLSAYNPAIYDRESARFGVAAFPGVPLSARDHIWILLGIEKKPACIFYATRDAEAGKIKPNAQIVYFSSEQECIDYLLAPFDSDWNLDTAEIAAGHWWDCWQKRSADTMENTFGFYPFYLNDLEILKPGQHPGGRTYWVTPRPDVLCIHHIGLKDEE